ncbi:MAG: hypothetical protein ACLQE9_04790, partial [Roseiarcus sp.]
MQIGAGGLALRAGESRLDGGERRKNPKHSRSGRDSAIPPTAGRGFVDCLFLSGRYCGLSRATGRPGVGCGASCLGRRAACGAGFVAEGTTREDDQMPKVKVNDITMNYESQGAG